MLHARLTVLDDKNYAAAIFCACALAPGILGARVRALDAPRDHTKYVYKIILAEQSSGLNAILQACKKEQRQVNKKFCELKGGNIGIVEKAQETRFGMSPKYSTYIRIAS